MKHQTGQIFGIRGAWTGYQLYGLLIQHPYVNKPIHLFEPYLQDETSIYLMDCWLACSIHSIFFFISPYFYNMATKCCTVAEKSCNFAPHLLFKERQWDFHFRVSPGCCVCHHSSSMEMSVNSLEKTISLITNPILSVTLKFKLKITDDKCLF